MNDSGNTLVKSGPEHPMPQCPNCEGHKTRPLDDEHATCFDCGLDWKMTEEVQEAVKDAR